MSKILNRVDPQYVTDYRGIPTARCPCGGDLLKVIAIFDDEYEISMYMLDAECYYCGAQVTAPTPLDLHAKTNLVTV
jgi:hypothetical protein